MKHPPISKSLQLLSKHRQFLYGFAALWILFFHWTVPVPKAGLLIPLHEFQKIGACGVEIFLLLTGFGLYYSLLKNPSVTSFYKNRILRVFLPSFLVMCVFNFPKYDALLPYLASCTFLGYWFGVKTVWYIAFILTMYLLYPLLFRLQKKHPLLLLIPAAVSFGLCLVLENMDPEGNREILRGISRIPVFLFGCMIAPCVQQGKTVPKGTFWWILGSLPLFTLLWETMEEYGHSYSFRALAYCSYALLAIYVLCFAAEYSCRHGKETALYRFLAFCGGLSLEIYLFFERFLDLLDNFSVFQGYPYSDVVLNAAATVLAFVFAILLQRGCAYLIKILKSRSLL